MKLRRWILLGAFATIPITYTKTDWRSTLDFPKLLCVGKLFTPTLLPAQVQCFGAKRLPKHTRARRTELSHLARGS